MRFPRTSGVLLHPTSLPGPHGSGDFGANAYHFVDWLVAAGQKLWQILPLGGIGPGNSPYMSSSAFAGNVLLIDLAELQQHGWLGADALAHPPAADPRRIDFATRTPPANVFWNGESWSASVPSGSSLRRSRPISTSSTLLSRSSSCGYR